jgi:predicted dehydrogenase
MSHSIAFVGFRHPHIQDLLKRVQEHSNLDLVAVCEEDDQARAQLQATPPCELIFDSYSEMLDKVSCDIVAVGDTFGKRGQRVIEALQRGLHVISDKPICTDLEELELITKLSQEKGLAVGCMFDLRDHPNFLALHKIVRDGEIGEVCAISFGGQHPLNYGTRASWYFEPKEHGGTLNDIAIHAFDFLPWITGSEISTINAARAWNANFTEEPEFENAAQIMLQLENGASVIGDASYLIPNSFGYSLHYYWRTTIWGTQGVAETSMTTEGVVLHQNGQTEPKTITAPATPGGYLEAFLQDIQTPGGNGLASTKSNLQAQRVALLAQKAATSTITNLEVNSSN